MPALVFFRTPFNANVSALYTTIQYDFQCSLQHRSTPLLVFFAAQFEAIFDFLLASLKQYENLSYHLFIYSKFSSMLLSSKHISGFFSRPKCCIHQDKFLFLEYKQTIF